MNILQISIYDIGGGAERVAWDLHNTYLKLGHNSCLVVGWKRSDSPTVIGLAKERYSLNWFVNGILRRLEKYSGIQAWSYRGFLRWWRKNKQNWDIVHFHNLHSSYFNIGILPEITRTHPIVQTLHDCWTFTGHCAHPFLCERWEYGCGKCPDLSYYPSISSDRTRFNWKRKKRIYEKAMPVLVCPSLWLKKMVEESFLKNMCCEVIYNGIDLTKFSSVFDKKSIREQIGLPKDKIILLFVANGGLHNSHFKDPESLLEAFQILIKKDFNNKIVLLSIGGKKRELPKEIDPYIIQLPYTQERLEQIYQAGDIFVYPTKADNCPISLIEAMACGLPVVTTDIGGCRELVVDSETGIIVSPNNPIEIVEAVKRIINEGAQRYGMKGRERAENIFGSQRMAEQYLNLYKELIREKRSTYD